MMSTGPARSDMIQSGNQTFRICNGPGFDIIRTQIQEIDPNLELAHPEHAPQGWAVLWNGYDGLWHPVTVNKSGDHRQLIMLPEILRRRDQESPVNSRISAFERDVKQQELDEAAREAESDAAISEAMQRVYHGLRKDVGYHYGVTSKQYFTFGSNHAAE